VVDDRGRTLWSRDPHSRRANASTTKMLTALVAVRRSSPRDTASVSAEAAATGGGGLTLRAGERFSVRALLQALLLSSSNDAAVALAEHVSGTEERFVAEMNAVAARIGAHRSHFLTAHGLDRPGHVSTASDLALIAARLLEHPLLRRVVATSETTIAGPDGPIPLENRNVLLDTYKGAIGVKTGFTAAAGDVLVGAARRRGRRVIAVAMGSASAADDVRRLLDWGFDRLRRSMLLRPGRAVGWLVFDPGGAVVARAGRAARGLADPGELEARFHPDPRTRPPLRHGDVVGRVTLVAGGRAVTSVPAVAAGSVTRSRPPTVLELLGKLLRTAHALVPGVGAT
jgi:D-alanyl-D-alanine carboxypeptidase (penicillin-binding protein 5/6)